MKRHYPWSPAAYSLVFVETHVLAIDVFDCEFVDGIGILPPVFRLLTSLPQYTAGLRHKTEYM